MTKIQKLIQMYRAEKAKAQKTGRCPMCGAQLGPQNQLLDRGWRYGVECDNCR